MASQISIYSNVTSLQAQRRLSFCTGELASVFQRLSSGQRINRASDDAAGLAVAAQLNYKTKIYTQGIRNINDGISLVSVTDGALSSLSGIVTRLQELAEQSANGVYRNTQRVPINREAQALSSEYNRITQTASFNDINLLDGSTSSLTLVGGDSTVTLDLNSTAAAHAIGTGTLSAQAQAPSVNKPNGEVIADFNGDGFGDIAVVHSFSATDGMTVHIGNGDGTFKGAVTYAVGGSSSIQSADFNRDGVSDLVVADGTNNVLQLFYGVGNGTFSAAVSLSTGAAGGQFDVAVGDLNGDSSWDIVWTYGWGNQSFVFIGNGDGTFKAPVSYGTTGSSLTPVLADFNGDGNLDLASTSYSTDDIGINFGAGDGTFGSVAGVVHLVPGTSRYFSAGDVNGDTLDDLVTSDYPNGKIDVYISNGDGTFKAGVSYGTGGVNYSQGRLADVNGDGKLDAIVAAEYSNAVHLLLSNGDGSFKAAVSVDVGTAADTLAVGDLNKDGVPDAVIGDFQVPGHIVPILANAIAAGTSGASVAQVIALGTIDLSTQQGARDALDSLRGVQQSLAVERGIFGAFESRLNVFVSTLSVGRENFVEAASRIQDSDIAQDAASLTRLRILQQAAGAVLAQANLEPQITLKLLGSI